MNMLWSLLGRKNVRKEILEERLGKAGALLFVVCKMEELGHVSNSRCHGGKTGATRWKHNGWRRQEVTESHSKEHEEESWSPPKPWHLLQVPSASK